MSKKKAKLKRFEILVPTTSYTVFPVRAVDEEQAVEMVLSGDLDAYGTVEEDLDYDSNNYIVNEVEN